jgi:anti-sigma regulatory factor (Ser/Thr protein kinase)
MERTPQRGEVTLLRLTTPAHAESIQVTRRTAEVLERLHLSEELGARLALVVTELATNVVKHSTGRTIEVELTLTSARLTGSVRDSGYGFAVGTPRLPRPDAAGGRGLYLLERLTDEWHVDTSDGTCVSFSFALDDGIADRRRPRAANREGAGRPDERRP